MITDSLHESLKEKFPDQYLSVPFSKSQLIEYTKELHTQIAQKELNALLIVSLLDVNFFYKTLDDFVDVYNKNALSYVLSNSGMKGIENSDSIPIALTDDDPLTKDWTIIVLDEKYTVTFTAQLVKRTETLVFGEDDEYDVAWSFNPDITAEAVRLLSQHLGSKYDPSLNGKLREMISLKLKPISPEQQVINHKDFYKRATKNLYDRNRTMQNDYFWLSVLRKVQAAVVNELDSINLMQQFCKTLIETLEPTVGGIELYNAQKKKVELEISWENFSIQIEHVLPEVQLVSKETQKIVSADQTVVFDNIRQDKRLKYPIKLAERGIQSGIAIPFDRSETGILGILLLFFQPKLEFGDEEVRWLIEITDVLANSLEAAKLQLKVNKLAITDGLTGLYNHRAFQRRLQEECQRTDRYQNSLTLVILDIDYFKHYNDTHGHPQGDVVLKMVSRILVDTVRSVDVVSRYGGEEFTVLLPETSINEGLIVAEKVRSAVEKHVFPHQNVQPDGNLTISLGVGEYVFDTSSPEELINKADQALYRAKRNGRNRVYC